MSSRRLSRLVGWKRLPVGYRTPDLDSPFGTVEVKTRARYFDPIPIDTNPDLAVLCYYYLDGGVPHISWVNYYTREYLESHDWKINIARGLWASRSKKKILISPSCFLDVPRRP
jgi:hypothetical protein